MEIFGLSPVLATIIIVTTGLMLQNLLGWLKSKESYDIKNALASTIIAFVVGSNSRPNVIRVIPTNDIC